MSYSCKTILKINQDNHKIKLIIALPRSNSSILELILSLSDSVSKNIHEPFLNFGYYNNKAETIYRNIIEKTNKTNKNSIFIIKEMSQWLTKNDEYKNFIKYLDTPILLVVRNPFLNIESKIIKILQSANNRERIGLYLHYLKPLLSLNNTQKLNTQEILNKFANKYRYNSWDEILRIEALEKRNLVLFEPIIKYFTDQSSGDIWGWNCMNNIKKYFDKNKIPYKILIGTDLRLLPELVIKEICNIFSIRFNKKMLTPGKDLLQKKFNLKKTQSSGEFWYHKMLSQGKIFKPIEQPLPLKNYPADIQSYLIEKCIPLYRIFSKNPNRINVFTNALSKYKKLIIKHKKIDPLYYSINKHLL